MAKKDFTKVNTTPVYNTIDAATSESAQPVKLPRYSRSKERTGAEIKAAQDAGRTQGRKGCAMARINMAFTPELHDYIKTMARVRGESITEFTNHIFKQSMIDNAEIYEQAKKFKNSF